MPFYSSINGKRLFLGRPCTFVIKLFSFFYANIGIVAAEVHNS